MGCDFQAALQERDLAAIKRCPKGDLHNHAMLGGSRRFLAKSTGRHFGPLDCKLASMTEMHAWVEENIGDAFEGREGRLLAFEATLVQACDDGVTRLEIGEDVWAITKYEGSAEELTDRLKRLQVAVAPAIEWIPQLGLSRHCAVDALDCWLSPFLELGFYRTLDLYGDEFAQPIERFKPLFRKAKKAGLRLKAHVGEWGSSEDVRRAVGELELEEVQHGIAAASSPATMRFLADNRIRLNVCPTSNVMMGRVAGIEQHPIRRLYDAGVPVTVNSDDVLVFGPGVSEEFLSLYAAEVFTASELDEIRKTALTDEIAHPKFEVTEIAIRMEEANDFQRIRAIHERSFPTSGEANLVDRLRLGGDLVFSLVAAIGGEVVGHMALSKMRAPFRALGLGPIAVLPNRRRRGVAACLIKEGLARAHAGGWEGVFVLGDPAYYSRFGFSTRLAAGFSCRYSGPHFMALLLASLRAPALTGEIVYPAAFAGLD
jgi:predicted N-acetyltransferase YhbS